MEPYIKKWLADGLDFAMEEDNDSGHGTMNLNSTAFRWKKYHNLLRYANAPHSPDLAIIETCWSAPKYNMKKSTYYDNETMKELILEGWDRLNYKGVNSIVHSIPQRLWDVID